MSLVHIDTATIDSLIANEEARKTFSFLRTAKLIMDSQREYNRRNEKRCKKCDKTDAIKTSTYQSIKRAIASMSSIQQDKLKALLNADTIKVAYRTGLKTSEVEF